MQLTNDLCVLIHCASIPDQSTTMTAQKRVKTSDEHGTSAQPTWCDSVLHVCTCIASALLYTTEVVMNVQLVLTASFRFAS